MAGLLQVSVWLVTLEVFSRVASGIIPALSDLSIPVSLFGWGILYFILAIFCSLLCTRHWLYQRYRQGRTGLVDYFRLACGIALLF